MKRKKVVAGNWKMHGTPKEAQELLLQLTGLIAVHSSPTVVVCPPFVLLQAACNLLQGSTLLLGAQDCSERKPGAFTGDISASMLLTMGVSHVILGHSERRQYHQETDQLVNAKLRAVLEAGMVPIVCVGETLAQRETDQTESVVRTQAMGVFAGLSAEQFARVTVAYEPVWAIGTGKTATPKQAQEVHAYLRSVLAGQFGADLAASVPILYGGSVKGANALELLRQEDIDGALVGGASLHAEEFAAIVSAAVEVQ